MKILLFANTDWYLYNFRRALAEDLLGHGHEVVLVSPAGEYAPKLRRAGFQWRELPIDRRSLNPLEAMRTLARLCILYRRERPDLVHHFTLKCVIFGGMAARLCAVPAVVNAVAGMGFIFSSGSMRARLLRPLVRAVLKSVLSVPGSRLIVQNPDDGAALERAGVVRPDLVRLIRGSGVDTARFQPRATATTGAPVLRVLLATRLLWDKGVREFVEAARLLKQAGVAAECLLAGEPDEGNPNAVPRARIDSWRCEGVIVALGHVDDMPALFERTDVVVLLTAYGEGVPRVLLEAAASGLPIVASDAPGCREIVEHGVTGLLVPARNAGALAAALQNLSDSPQLRRQYGAAGRLKAVAEFDQRIVLNATRDVYNELVADRPSRSAVSPFRDDTAAYESK